MKTENYNCNMESGHYHCAERLALGAIIAGVLVTLAYKALFHLLGVGIGLFSFHEYDFGD
jgi:hypothetical protein